MSVPVGAVLAEAIRFAGQRYVFGAEIDSKPGNYVGPVDCSELIQHACKRAGVTPTMPDGAYWQWRHSRAQAISVAEARDIPGALMFIGDGTGTGRQAITHVGLSLGDGRTFEARGAAWPVGLFERRTGWTYAALIPGVDHLPPRSTMTPEEARAFVGERYRDSLGRDPDAGGEAYWAELITKGLATPAEVGLGIKAAADKEQNAAIRELLDRVARLEKRPAGLVSLSDGVYRIEAVK